MRCPNPRCLIDCTLLAVSRLHPHVREQRPSPRSPRSGHLQVPDWRDAVPRVQAPPVGGRDPVFRAVQRGALRGLHRPHQGVPLLGLLGQADRVRPHPGAAHDHDLRASQGLRAHRGAPEAFCRGTRTRTALRYTPCYTRRYMPGNTPRVTHPVLHTLLHTLCYTLHTLFHALLHTLLHTPLHAR